MSVLFSSVAQSKVLSPLLIAAQSACLSLYTSLLGIFSLLNLDLTPDLQDKNESDTLISTIK